jgi:ABC-type nitrate/sulfonate/bicarbonate transport system substrate-binding protein
MRETAVSGPRPGRRQGRHWRYMASGAAVLLAAASIAACSSSSSGGNSSNTSGTGNGSASTGAASSAAIPVSIQEFPGTPITWLEDVAYDKGFFSKNGLNVKMVSVLGSTLEMAALEGGSVDVISGTPESFIASSGKLGMEAIDSNATGLLQLIANKTIPKVSGGLIAQLKELKGKTILISGLGSSVQYATEALMASAGLQYPQDYSFAVVSGSAAQLAALESNRVQAWMAIQPVVDQLVTSGNGFLVDNFAAPSEKGTAPLQYTSGFPVVDMFSLKSWAQANPEAVKDIQKALAQAYMWVENPANFQAVESEVTSVYGASLIPKGDLAALTKQQISVAAAWLPAAAVQPFIDFDVKYKFLSSSIPASQILAPGTPASESAAIALANS